MDERQDKTILALSFEAVALRCFCQVFGGSSEVMARMGVELRFLIGE